MNADDDANMKRMTFIVLNWSQDHNNQEHGADLSVRISSDSFSCNLSVLHFRVSAGVFHSFLLTLSVKFFSCCYLAWLILATVYLLFFFPVYQSSYIIMFVFFINDRYHILTWHNVIKIYNIYLIIQDHWSMVKSENGSRVRWVRWVVGHCEWPVVASVLWIIFSDLVYKCHWSEVSRLIQSPIYDRSIDRSIDLIIMRFTEA